MVLAVITASLMTGTTNIEYKNVIILLFYYSLSFIKRMFNIERIKQ